ncbi:hypothetical protein RND71_013935 [Anisodus tanguticus]|uniref:Uncharacterized protein n=1 Tax=Anisodus tanguticus TaxID=243964 RepID=A0AAE1VN94_9SOLA|nr:hypothetical protein RND71_013935 [Anisodus tanguticus]
MQSDKIEAMVAAAIPYSSDDSQEVQELDVSRLYLDVVGEEKKRCAYGLGSQVLTLYQDQDSATLCNLPVVIDRVVEERIKLLEEEMLRMRKN